VVGFLKVGHFLISRDSYDQLPTRTCRQGVTFRVPDDIIYMFDV